MFWRFNDLISEFGVGVGACFWKFCSTAIRLRRGRRGLRKKHANAHATKKNQQRFDRPGLLRPVTFCLILRAITSSCASEPCRSRFPCGKRVRWLRWSRLTDLAQLQSPLTPRSVKSFFLVGFFLFLDMTCARSPRFELASLLVRLNHFVS